MANWLNLGQIFSVNAIKFSENIAFMDKDRSFTFHQSNKRINSLANAMLNLGIKKGETVSCLLENCIEICELYIATAKIGVILNPINFRASPQDVVFIINNSDSKTVFICDQFVNAGKMLVHELVNVKDIFVVGKPRKEFESYDTLLESGGENEPPDQGVVPADPWIILYTSGTTGLPKGVVRSHESYIAFYLISGVDFKYSSKEIVLTVMPLCHVNATFFSFAATYFGGANYVHPAAGFKASQILSIISQKSITFISLIPTHYNLIMALSSQERAKYNVSCIEKLLCSSAPAKIEQKQDILAYFKGVKLYEGYGSTEAGIVTTLMPEDQLTHPGSIGKESSGTDIIKILDTEGKDVEVNEIGELYSSGPMMFNGYYKMSQETKNSFNGQYFSAGDMAKKDKSGYYFLVDRKQNMIITGGEHVFPSQVEGIISKHPAVYDVAVIGVPDPKWTESVMAVVVLAKGQLANETEIIAFSKQHLASFKCPKKVVFIDDNKMPRSATGKMLHRVLSKRYSQ